MYLYMCTCAEVELSKDFQIGKAGPNHFDSPKFLLLNYFGKCDHRLQ